MKLQNVTLVAELATQLASIEAFHAKAGERTYGRAKEEYFQLNLNREDMATISTVVLRESALALIVAERERIKKLMRGYGVQFPDDPAPGSVTPVLAGQFAEARS